MKRIPTHCPACDNLLEVTRMECRDCRTGIEGRFELPPLGQLSDDDQRFIMQFVAASGSLKEMARILRLSYPTVRNRLNDVIGRCNSLAQEPHDDEEHHDDPTE